MSTEQKIGVCSATTIQTNNLELKTENGGLRWGVRNSAIKLMNSGNTAFLRNPRKGSGDEYKSALGNIGFIAGTDSDKWGLTTNSDSTVRIGVATADKDLNANDDIENYLSVHVVLKKDSEVVVSLTKTQLIVKYGAKSFPVDLNPLDGKKVFPLITSMPSSGFLATIELVEVMKMYIDNDVCPVFDTTKGIGVVKKIQFKTGGGGVEIDGGLSVSGPITVANVSTAERSALSATTGSIVYNTDSNELNVYHGTRWQSLLTSQPNHVAPFVDVCFEPRAIATDGSWKCVAWSPELGVFVAVSSDGAGNDQVMRSRDGIAWSASNSTVDIPASAWAGVAWAAELGTFAAVAASETHQVMTSPDGDEWTAQTTDGSWNAIAWSSDLGRFVAVSDTATMTSPDAITWSITPISNSLQCVIWSKELGMFVAVGDGSVATSTGGSLWKPRACHAYPWKSLAWSPSGLLVAVAETGEIMTSPDAVAWSMQASPGGSWNSVTWAAGIGLFVAVGQSDGAEIMTSLDGIGWITQPAPDAFEWESVAWSPELSLLVSVAGTGSTTQVMASSGLNLKSLDRINIAQSKTITGSADPGKQGTMTWDTDYIYICTDDNTWRRIAHDTW
jgi:hypothetical protein